MKRTIRNLPFQRGDRSNLGVEVFPLGELFDRAERGAIDHALDAPQRPEFHTLYVGTRGRGKLVVDFTPVPLGAGYLTIVARGRVQQFVVDRRVDAWMLLFAPERVQMHPVLSRIEPALAIPTRDQLAIDVLVAALVAEHGRAPDAQQPAILDSLLRALLLHADRLAGEDAALPAPLARFFTILERDHPRTRSVEHYAKEAGISKRRLGELLAARLGKSTKQVIDERVILECKRLLAHTDVSVKELAERMGFDEPTNLVKFFKLHAKTTPLAFRDAQRTFLPSSGAS